MPLQKVQPNDEAGYVDDEAGYVEPLPGVPAPRSKVGLVKEAGAQATQLGKGFKDLLIGPKSGITDVAKGALEGFVMTPGRELLGKTQPGKSVLSAPQNLVDQLEGAFFSFLGGDPGAARMNAQHGDTGAAMADMFTVPAITLGAGSLLKKFLPARGLETEAEAASRAKTLTRATGRSPAVDIPKAVSVARPALMDVAQKVGVPSDIGGLANLTQQALTKLETDFGVKFQPIAGDLVDANPIANAIQAKKIPNPVTGYDVSYNSAMDRAAADFKKPLSYGQLNKQRMLAGDRLNPEYNRAPSAQAVKTNIDADIAADRVIQNTTRDMIYGALERKYQGQVPKGYFADLKKQQSSLIDLKDQVKKRAVWESNEKSMGRKERARAHLYMSSGGHVGGAIGGLNELAFPEYKAAAKAVKKGLSKPRDLRPLLGAGLPPLARHEEPSLAEDEEDQP
jgi:hypothetical protein